MSNICLTVFQSFNTNKNSVSRNKLLLFAAKSGFRPKNSCLTLFRHRNTPESDSILKKRTRLLLLFRNFDSRASFSENKLNFHAFQTPRPEKNSTFMLFRHQNTKKTTDLVSKLFRHSSLQKIQYSSRIRL